ncbi:MAG: ComF family protein [Dehalococcoidia bacterium]|nr:ComF family protein [Dehalococcoidia bacterium]
MMQLLGRLSRGAIDLVFPPQCALCQRGGTLLCDACAGALPAADGGRCPRCWMASPRSRPCRHCRASPPAFDGLRAAYVMEAGARRLVHELKYEGMTALAEPMARLMAAHAADDDADLIVPVPLHHSRERSRGYNQAAMLAGWLARRSGLPLDRRALRRVRNTAPLVTTMHRDERLAIMRGAFAADLERVDGRRLLLVDDVATTGATLDACAEALRACGVAAVRCLVWARAD